MMEGEQLAHCTLPPDARVQEIAGGNHAHFGNYGEQQGDGVATISCEDQQSQTADAVISLLDAIEQ